MKMWIRLLLSAPDARNLAPVTESLGGGNREYSWITYNKVNTEG